MFNCSRKLMGFALPATAATSTRKMTEKFMLVGGWRQGWWRLLWKRTSRRPDQGRGGDRELLKVDMNSVQVFTLGCFAIHKSSIPSTTPSNMNCQSLSSTSVKSGCMIDKKKPNQTFLKTVIKYMFGAIFRDVHIFKRLQSLLHCFILSTDRSHVCLKAL